MNIRPIVSALIYLRNSQHMLGSHPSHPRVSHLNTQDPNMVLGEGEILIREQALSRITR